MRSVSVLMVEDNLLVRGPVVEALAEAGYGTAEAGSAPAAKSLISARSFDVLVTDIHLDTRLAGLEVARHWRETRPGQPLVFATAYPRAAVDVGPLGPKDAYLQKPYGPAELLGIIRFVLR